MFAVGGFKLHRAPIAYYDIYRRCIEVAYEPERRAAIIGIDGYPFSGKTPLASWLAWQLGCPAIHTDEYHIGDGYELDIAAIESRILCRVSKELPVIVEGALLLETMETMKIDLALHVWVRRDVSVGSSLNERVFNYTLEHRHRGLNPDLVCEVHPEEFGDEMGTSRAWDLDIFEE